jgi:RNA polymerase sigma-70 factor (ECF subfamily)
MDIREADDGALARRAATGDESAAAELYDRHATMLVRSLTFFLRDAHAAEDATQEALIYFFRHAAEFDPARSPLRLWLRRIAHNFARNELRRRKRKPSLSLETPVSTASGEAKPLRELIPTPEPDAPTDLAGEMLSKLNELAEEDREVLVLRYLDGYTPAEIADVLGIKPRSVSMRLWRALKRLRKNVGIGDRPVDGPTPPVQ